MTAKCLSCLSHWNISTKKDVNELRAYKCPACSSKMKSVQQEAKEKVTLELINYNQTREFYPTGRNKVGFDAGTYFKVGDRIEYLRASQDKKSKGRNQKVKVIRGEIVAIYPHQLLIQCDTHKVNISRYPAEDEKFKLLRRAG